MIEMDPILKKAREMMALDQPEEALEILCTPNEDVTGEAIFLKGEIYFKLQRWGEALNQFSLFLEHNPNDKKSESYCVMIREILGFFHKDFYNP